MKLLFLVIYLLSVMACGSNHDNNSQNDSTNKSISSKRVKPDKGKLRPAGKKPAHYTTRQGSKAK